MNVSQNSDEQGTIDDLCKENLEPIEYTKKSYSLDKKGSDIFDYLNRNYSPVIHVVKIISKKSKKNGDESSTPRISPKPITVSYFEISHLLDVAQKSGINGTKYRILQRRLQDWLEPNGTVGRCIYLRQLHKTGCFEQVSNYCKKVI
jgi:hypothetical protein